MSSKQTDPARSTLRLGFLLAVLVMLMSAANSALGADGRWELAVGTATAAPQTAVELPVVLTSNGSSVSAIAFTVEFDASKLALDGGPTLGSKVEMPAPTMFTSSSWVGTEAGSIGVVVYDSVRPIGVLADGPIAKIRFRVLPDATGVAPVRVSASKPFSASGPRGEPLEGDIAAPGGVSIVTSTATTVVPEPETPPAGGRNRLTQRPRSSDDLTLVVPLLSDRNRTGAWTSSLLLHNRSEKTSTARLTLLRSGGFAPTGSVDISVPPGATRSWKDAATELFGLPGENGAIVIERGSEALVAATSAGGRGEITASEAAESELRIFALENHAGSHSNVSIANLDLVKARFTIEIRDAEGALLDVRAIEVDARSTRELPLGSHLAAGENLTVLLRSEGARYAAWSATFWGAGVPIVRIAR